MNTTTNTQGVSEAMVERGVAAYRKTTHSMPQTQHDRMRAALEAALSAPEPAAQGEEGFDARKYVRHMADVLEAGGDLFKVDADLLRLAAAINKAANTAPPAQPAERVPDEDYRQMAAAVAHLKNSGRHARAGVLLEKLLAASPAPSEGGKGVGRWTGEIECCDAKGFWLVLAAGCPFVPGQKVTITAAQGKGVEG